MRSPINGVGRSLDSFEGRVDLQPKADGSLTSCQMPLWIQYCRACNSATSRVHFADQMQSKQSKTSSRRRIHATTARKHLYL